MAKRISRKQQNELLIHKLWFNIVLAVASLGLSYGFFSWAINNGNLLFWGIAIFLLTWSVNRVIVGIHYKIS